MATATDKDTVETAEIKTHLLQEDGADDNDSDNDNDNDNDNKYYVNNNDIHDDIHYDPMYTDKDGKTRIG